jgi:hypothetical protein
MRCKICGKAPNEINEYIEMAEEKGLTPEEFVKTEEGTFNSSTEMFYCTECYIDIGMPLGTA